MLLDNRQRYGHFRAQHKRKKKKRITAKPFFFASGGRRLQNFLFTRNTTEKKKKKNICYSKLGIDDITRARAANRLDSKMI